MAELIAYLSDDYIREATAEELEESKNTALFDGGAGVILVDGVECYVQGEE